MVIKLCMPIIKIMASSAPQSSNIYYNFFYLCRGIMPRYKGWLHTNEPTRAHTTNEYWAWRMANKFASRIQVCLLRLSLQQIWCFKHCMWTIPLTYRYSYPLAAHSWRLWASQLDHQQNLCAARVRPPHTPVHYTAILGVPILPVPTLIEFLNKWAH